MYVISQSGKLPIFQLNQHIGFDDDEKDEVGNITERGDGQGIDGRIFSKEFFETDAFNPDLITTYINTMGGDVQESLDIFNAIARVKAKTKGIISGFAYSCGGWIALAHDIVEMAEYASWMCHLPYNPKNESERSQFLDNVLNMVSTIISSKSGRNGKPKKTVDEVKKMMQTKTYLNAKQMYDEGLIDRVVDASGKKIEMPKEESFAWNIETDYVTVKQYYKQRQIALNKFIDEAKPSKENNSITTTKNTIMKFPKVVNRFNKVKIMNFDLPEDAGEEEIVESIMRMETKVSNLSSDLSELNKLNKTTTDELKAANDSKAEMQKRLDEMQSAKNEIDTEVVNLKKKMENMEALNTELESFKMKEKDTELAVAKEKAKNLIKSYVDTGKIARLTGQSKEEFDKVVSGWEEDAVANFDKTKRQLDAIPVAMSLPRPNSDDTTDETRPSGGDGSYKHFAAANRQDRDKRLKEWEKNRPMQYTT